MLVRCRGCGAPTINPLHASLTLYRFATIYLMLKAELRAKMFQIDSEWTRVEDILTGDFFGVLDYLPRTPYLADFLNTVVALNETRSSPNLTDVDWDSVDVLFWPCETVDGQQVEPDVVIASNRWLIVVEVKLNSGLGHRQPWREYQAGLSIAHKRGLPQDAVFYLVVARSKLDVARTFSDAESHMRDELLDRTLFLCWWQAAAIVDSWRGRRSEDLHLNPAHARLVDDLLGSLRRRRSILFSGFSFAKVAGVQERLEHIFCPAAFAGFFSRTTPRTEVPSRPLFLNRFDGFLNRAACDRPCACMRVDRFGGFIKRAPTTPAPHAVIFASRPFQSFLRQAPLCQTARVWGSSSSRRPRGAQYRRT